MSDPFPRNLPRRVAPEAGPTPRPSREREGSETRVRAAGTSRSGVGADERPARGQRGTGVAVCAQVSPSLPSRLREGHYPLSANISWIIGCNFSVNCASTRQSLTRS
jgi:hypothetical protein